MKKEKSRMDRKKREFRENLDAREYVKENKAVGDDGGISATICKNKKETIVMNKLMKIKKEYTKI